MTSLKHGREQEKIIEKQLSFATLTVRMLRLGENYQIILQGGEKPHIGCTVLAIPRPSLTGDGSVSVTSSVLNVIGHKDEEICRYLAECAARKYDTVTVCTGGFHTDQITSAQIEELKKAVCEIGAEC